MHDLAMTATGDLRHCRVQDLPLNLDAVQKPVIYFPPGVYAMAARSNMSEGPPPLPHARMHKVTEGVPASRVSRGLELSCVPEQPYRVDLPCSGGLCQRRHTAAGLTDVLLRCVPPCLTRGGCNGATSICCPPNLAPLGTPSLCRTAGSVDKTEKRLRNCGSQDHMGLPGVRSF